MRYKQTPIFQHSYRLLIEIYKCTENFKKSHKYTLGEKFKTICHDMIDLIIIANSLKNKVETIDKL